MVLTVLCMDRVRPFRIDHTVSALVGLRVDFPTCHTVLPTKMALAGPFALLILFTPRGAYFDLASLRLGKAILSIGV